MFGGKPRLYRSEAETTRMSLVDAGQFPDGRKAVHFKCETCGYDQGWTYQRESDDAVMHRGRPCPQCNKRKELKP